MEIDIIQNGQVLRRIDHKGQTYVEAPTSGEYKLRVTNNYHRRRLAIVSVDGVNVVNGEDASFEGGGYVLEPWQIIEIPGFRRDDGTVAAFKFTEQGGSYAAQTGRGTKNVGVIGLAVFDEKVVRKVPEPPVVIHEHHHHHWGDGILRSRSGPAADYLDFEPERGTPIAARSPNVRQRRATKGVEPTKDVGTGYGREVRFHTRETTFTRATQKPAKVITLRYATRVRLESWGVPVEQPDKGPLAANPFPAAGPSVPPPPGWRG